MNSNSKEKRTKMAFFFFLCCFCVHIYWYWINTSFVRGYTHNSHRSMTSQTLNRIKNIFTSEMQTWNALNAMTALPSEREKMSTANINFRIMWFFETDCRDSSLCFKEMPWIKILFSLCLCWRREIKRDILLFKLKWMPEMNNETFDFFRKFKNWWNNRVELAKLDFPY